ncbi:MAG: NAD+ synthase [Elusimicrobiales bacterium]|nr:NAD+ synthase [Elusimicrobiales bacterium]
MKIAIAQINPRVGDIPGNFRLIEDFARAAQVLGADLAVFPELALTGYPPLDLLEKKNFIDENLKALKALAALKLDIGIAVGYVGRNPAKKGKPLHNAIALIHSGRIAAVRHKSLLPTYDIFDEARYFEPAARNAPVRFKGEVLGLTVCEDIWAGTALLPNRQLYRDNPARTLCAAKASIVINISASPFYRGKNALRRRILSGLAKDLGAHLIYVNQAGANDELIFDGNSFALSPAGKVTARAKAFGEDLVLVDTGTRAAAGQYGSEGQYGSSPAQLSEDVTAEICAALTLGIKDYFRKLGFSKALLGLSGGIDSAVVAALAAGALGPENVTGVLMPSEFTSRQSGEDALRLARNLGIKTKTIPIRKIYKAFLGGLKAEASPGQVTLTMQNLQARSRGSLLMALANANGWLNLVTGNKSEIAVGYCTLYGDTAGALAPIADLFKTEVYRLAAYLNRGGEVIPNAIIKRPPTAELKPGQKDQDDLPPYGQLDEILRLYLEENKTPSEIVGRGFGRKLVLSILRRVEINEYKRKQLPIALKVTEKSFGYGRKMPIVKALHFIK